MSDLKNTLDGINSRLDIVEGKIIEDVAVKVRQNETHEKTKKVYRILVRCGNN